MHKRGEPVKENSKWDVKVPYVYYNYKLTQHNRNMRRAHIAFIFADYAYQSRIYHYAVVPKVYSTTAQN